MLTSRNRRLGFTLVELAIALVIIALIVAGVLVGQELISQARIRKVMIQLTQYDQARNTFYTKYNAIPGDFNNAYNAMPGLVSATSCTNDIRTSAVGSECNGNGNGTVETNGEDLLFWAHLSYAGLIAGNYSGAVGAEASTSSVMDTVYIGGVTAPWIGAHKGVVQPIDAPTGIVSSAQPGKLYYNLASLFGPASVPRGNAFTSVEASIIDNKMDDGNGNTGIVLASGRTVDDCATSITGVYTLSANIVCILYVRSQ